MNYILATALVLFVAVTIGYIYGRNDVNPFEGKLTDEIE